MKKEAPTPRIAYRMKEAARQLSVSERQMRRWVSSGRINASRAGRKCLLITATELERFLREGMAT